MMRRGRIRAGKVGCVGWVLLIVISIGLMSLAAKDRPPGAAPDITPVAPPSAPDPAPASRSLQVGDAVIVEVVGNMRVFLATTDDSLDPMIEAQNARSLELMARLIERGAVIAPPNGSRGVLVKNGFFSKLVRLTGGDFAGQEGWVQGEFVKQAPPIADVIAAPEAGPEARPAAPPRRRKRR